MHDTLTKIKDLGNRLLSHRADALSACQLRSPSISSMQGTCGTCCNNWTYTARPKHIL